MQFLGKVVYVSVVVQRQVPRWTSRDHAATGSSSSVTAGGCFRFSSTSFMKILRRVLVVFGAFCSIFRTPPHEVSPGFQGDDFFVSQGGRWRGRRESRLPGDLPPISLSDCCSDQCGVTIHTHQVVSQTTPTNQQTNKPTNQQTNKPTNQQQQPTTTTTTLRSHSGSSTWILPDTQFLRAWASYRCYLVQDSEIHFEESGAI